jgi:hypothetical protein
VTVGDVLALTWRHWLVSLLMAALLALGLTWAVHRHEAYNGQVAVLLLAPVNAGQNALASTTASLIATTGIISGAVNGPGPGAQTVNDQTLASAGIARGWSARQPNRGGQWDNDFEDPYLDVRSTGPTAAVSQAEMAVALDRIQAALTTLQDARSVPADQRIRTVLNPTVPVYVKQSGSRLRALGAVGILGLLAWGAALVVAERRRPRLLPSGLVADVPRPRRPREVAAVRGLDRG